MSTPEDRLNLIDLQKSKRLLLIPLKIHLPYRNIKTNALLDSGANGTFVHPDFVRKHKLPKIPLKVPRETFNADGTTQDKQMTHHTKLDVTINGKRMTITPGIITLNGYDIFLGMSWLKDHNPDIDWSQATLKWRDEISSIQLMTVEDHIKYLTTIAQPIEQA